MISIDLLEHQSGMPAEASIRLNEVVKQVFKSKRATVLTGAGISCNAGIPDFRSSDGLYNMVKSKYPKSIVKGQDLFDVSLFRNEMSLSIFCTFMESLYSSSLMANATETHKFIKTLKEKNKLLRCYTQNIDSLESSIDLTVGVNGEDFMDSKKFAQNWKNLDVVQLHGNLHKLACTICFSNFDWTEKYQAQLSQGLNPQCTKCFEKYEERLYSGKRLTGTIGLLRPDIVLYGENHPQSEILTQGLNVDIKSRPDLLLVMGTSLKVDGVKKLVKSLSASIRSRGGKVVYVNKTPLSKSWDTHFDYEVISDCDLFVKVLKKEIPDLFLTQEQLDSVRLRNNQEILVKKEDEDETDSLVKCESIKKEASTDIPLKKSKDIPIKKEKVKTEKVKKEKVKKETQHIRAKSEPASIPKVPSKKLQAEANRKQKTVAELKAAKKLPGKRIIDQAEDEEILTPPTTPTKKRKPALKRGTGSTIRGTSDYTLPSPISSFSEGSSPVPEYIIDENKPLRTFTRSQNCIVKQEEEFAYDCSPLAVPPNKKIRV